MGYIRLKRLNEHHDNEMPAELLNMTVGEMLDKVGELDTNGDAEYEVIEDALRAISDNILGTGYEADEVDFTPDGVENTGDEEDEDHDPLSHQIETYDEIAGQQDMAQGQNTPDNGMNMDNYTF
jgi:hypothetical protein